MKKSISYIVYRISYGKYGMPGIHTRYQILNTTYGARSAGFTLVETLVAVMLLSVAVVAPMSLAARSLGSAYYARDQITAFYLAQEAIEALRSIRDSQILLIAGSSSGAPPDIFGLIPHQNEPFMVDGRKGDASTAITLCDWECDPLQTDNTLYGYPGVGDDPSLWTPTHFTRTIHAYAIPGNADEIRGAGTGPR